MKHEKRNENTSRKEQDMLGVGLAGTDASSSHLVMVYALFQWSERSQYYDESEWSLLFRKIMNIMCEWSHSYDESEWSLMTSLKRRFGVPYE